MRTSNIANVNTLKVWAYGVAAVAAALCVTAGALALPPSTSAAQPHPIAAAHGAEIMWTTDDSVCASGERGGCYLPETPDVIWVSEGLPADLEEYVILHELGHLIQARNGEAFNECAADRYAQTHGAQFGEYCAPIG